MEEEKKYDVNDEKKELTAFGQLAKRLDEMQSAREKMEASIDMLIESHKRMVLNGTPTEPEQASTGDEPLREIFQEDKDSREA